MEGDDGGGERIDAGELGAWARQIRDAIDGERASDVPCGSCSACCTASQFVHIGPDETDALAHVPAELLFPAPFLPPGHKVMGYDQAGHCPMLVEGRCSIYEHRPRTCRTYDCRIFTATGVAVEADQPLIAKRVARWAFDHPSVDDRVRHRAMGAAARFLAEHPDLWGEGRPGAGAPLAVAALEIHHLFLEMGPGGELQAVDAPDPEMVREALRASRRSQGGGRHDQRRQDEGRKGQGRQRQRRGPT